MPSPAHLHRAVQSALTSKRLGTPVFVRYVCHGHGRGLDRLAQALAAVRVWIGQDFERLYALGTVKSGQVSLTVEFRGGATALIGWSAAAGGVDLTLLGNRGALYHDAGAARLWDEASEPLPDKPDPDLVAWIERALRSGRPEPASGGPP